MKLGINKERRFMDFNQCEDRNLVQKKKKKQLQYLIQRKREKVIDLS
jgi:hypothetical protein